MGAVASSVRDAGLQRLAFNAPPCGYADTECEIVYTAGGLKVTMKLFTPDAGQTVRVDDTRQRWLARMDYNDSRLLCIYSHGNSDDLGTGAMYMQWMANTFDMNVARIAARALSRTRALSPARARLH